MGEIIKISDFNKEEQNNEPRKNGDKVPVSFEESKEIIEMERKYKDFEEKYKKLAFRQLDPKGREALKIEATSLIQDIAEFEGQIKILHAELIRRSPERGDRLMEDVKTKGFEIAKKEYEITTGRDIDRSNKLLDLENKAAVLKDQVTSFFE